jgi:PhnB protein
VSARDDPRPDVKEEAMSTATTKTAGDETRVRKTIEDWIGAVRAKDAAAAVRLYAPEVLSFDVAPPLQQRGADTLRRSLEGWFATFRGPVGYELRDLRVVVGGDVAFAHALCHLTGNRTDGERTDVWMRTTVCLRQLGGDWRIVHEHTSVPLYMDGSLRAAVDLKP